MKALRFSRKPARYAAAAVASRLRPGAGGSWGPLGLRLDADPPALPGEGWQRVYPRVSGICGSDLATIDGRSARYFEDYASFPFTPGHEIVADASDGRRVVVEPVLGHAARGFEPPFRGAAPGDGNDYRHLVCGHLKPGLQTGFCASTGGGWSTELVAHESQLHDVPDWMSDEQAAMIEPAAAGVHAALRTGAGPGDTVAVVGAGTMGLMAVAALRHLAEPASIIAGGRYGTQRALALELGADAAVDSDDLHRAVRRSSGSFLIGDHLSGGADAVIDAVGSSRSLAAALALCRPRGRVVMLGMPSTVTVELTGLWHRETELVAATPTAPRTAAADAAPPASSWPSSWPARWPSTGWYRLCTRSTATPKRSATRPEAGRRGAVKIAFDMREERHRGIR